MNPFSSKPKNRRCRTRSRTSEDSWKSEPQGGSIVSKSPGKGGKLDQQVYQLNAKIGALETFIAKKAQADISRIQMKRENILPPPDKSARRRVSKKQLSHAERRRYHLERSRNGIQFLVLFCLACAIGWWLIFSGV